MHKKNGTYSMINHIAGSAGETPSQNRRRRKAGTPRGHARNNLLLEALEPRTLLSSTPTGAVAVFNNSTISGWAFNSDDGSWPVNVVITINGVATTINANQNESINTKLGSPLHGFSYTVPTLPPGKNSVVVQAISTTTGTIHTLKSGFLTNAAPTGTASISKDGSTLTGYVHDANSAGPIEVQIDVDGVAGTPFTTNLLNAAAAKKYHSGTVTLGFSETGSFTGHVVQVYAIDQPSSDPVLIYSNDKKPTGKVTVNNGFTVSGWAFDADAGSTPTEVEVKVDGVVLNGTPELADTLDAAVPKSLGSTDHGFSIAIPGLTPGKHTISIYAVDVYPNGQATAQPPVLIGSSVVTNGVPVGHLNQPPSTVTLTGWALDPDLGTAPATVNLYVDDSFFGSFTADAPNVPGIPAKDKNHAFSIDISDLPAGSHSITLTVDDNRTSDENEVVFYDGFIENHKPIGAIQTVTGTQITGWAYDPDTAADPIPVDVYVDGIYAETVSADQAAAGVSQLSGLPNDDHGFVANLPALSYGKHKIQIYAAESQGNVSVLIGTMTVTNNRPIGAVETVNATTVVGWAADPDTLGSSIQVEVYVNGVLAITRTAGIPRPDLTTKPPLSTDPGFDEYGYSLTLTGLSSGANEVDVYAVDSNNGMVSPLGSAVITI